MKNLYLLLLLLLVSVAQADVTILGTPLTPSTFATAVTPETGADAVVWAISAKGTTNLDITAITITGSVSGTATLAGGTVGIKKARWDTGSDIIAAVIYILAPDIPVGDLTGAITFSGTQVGDGRTVFYSLNSTTGLLALDNTDEMIIATNTDPWSQSLLAANGTAQILSAALSTAGNTTTPATNWTELRDVNDGGYRFVSQRRLTTTGGSIGWTVNPATTDTGAVAVASFKEASVAPTFTTPPAISGRSTNSITVGYTIAAPCSGCIFYGVAAPDATATPTCAAIIAQTVPSAYKYLVDNSIATGSPDTSAFSAYTDGTIRDTFYCAGNPGGQTSTVTAIADVYKTPAFSVTPAITARTAVGYTIAKTLDGPGTVYAVACTKNSVAPTVTQVEAAHCTGDAAAQAAINGNATASLSLGGALAKPVYDLYFAGTYGSQHQAAPASLTNELLSCPVGKQCAVLSSIYTGPEGPSPCQDLNTRFSLGIVAGDIIKADLQTDPQNLGVLLEPDCTLSYGFDNLARQKVLYDIYSVSGGAYLGTGSGTIWFNNHVPESTDTDTLIFTMDEDVAITDVDQRGFCLDLDNDTLVATNVSGLPPGLSVVSSLLTGTPTIAGIYTVVNRCTDVPGESFDFTSIYIVGDISPPNVVGLNIGAAMDSLHSKYFEVADPVTLVCDGSTPSGQVKAQDPESTDVAAPFSEVALTVSKGSCGGGKAKLNISIKVHQ